MLNWIISVLMVVLILVSLTVLVSSGDAIISALDDCSDNTDYTGDH